jgi:hypothetical protein
VSTKAGNLLWNRRRISVGAGNTTAFDTGLRQTNMGFEASSSGEPPIAIPGAVPPLPGTTPGSRVQVIPMAPLDAWADITHSEPYLNPATNTVWVDFSSDDEVTVNLNVLFWDPHTGVGPGQADPYGDGQR